MINEQCDALSSQIAPFTQRKLKDGHLCGACLDKLSFDSCRKDSAAVPGDDIMNYGMPARDRVRRYVPTHKQLAHGAPVPNACPLHRLHCGSRRLRRYVRLARPSNAPRSRDATVPPAGGPLR
jgi:hypothetical protein